MSESHNHERRGGGEKEGGTMTDRSAMPEPYFDEESGQWYYSRRSYLHARQTKKRAADKRAATAREEQARYERLLRLDADERERRAPGQRALGDAETARLPAYLVRGCR